MPIIKTPRQIATMRQSAHILSKVHGHIADAIKPGVSKIAINDVAEEAIYAYGGKPSFKGYQGFPAATCICVNDEVVHVIPDGYVLQEGDIVTVDCGVLYDGFHSDSAFTHRVGKVAKELLDLLSVTKAAMYKGVEALQVGNRIGDVGHAIQTHVEKHGYAVVRDYVGHGIGRQLHEDPVVPNYGKPGDGVPVHEGMVVAIEPMVNMGSHEVYEDGEWNVLTIDGKPSCCFENTVAVVEGKPVLLTNFDYIEKRKNYDE